MDLWPLDLERAQHAACLHIAEGHKGWEHVLFSSKFPDSEAMRAVRKLRHQMLDTKREAQTRGWNQG